jgi:hypothetical protein
MLKVPTIAESSTRDYRHNQLINGTRQQNLSFSAALIVMSGSLE